MQNARPGAGYGRFFELCKKQAQVEDSSLLRLAYRNCFRPSDRAQPFSYGRVPRDEPHALAESFAFSGGLAGVTIGSVHGGSVTAQTNFSRRLGHMPSALGISRSPLFILRLGLGHGTPPVIGFRRKPSRQSKALIHPAPGLACRDYRLLLHCVSIAQLPANTSQRF